MRPFTVCLFRESKLLASATFLLKKKRKVYLEDCESRRHFVFWIGGKDVVSAGFHSCVGF